MSEDRERIRRIVEDVLRMHPKTREDDRYLVIYVWRRYTGNRFPYVPRDVIEAIPSPETITRIRRRLQNDEGKYLPPKDVRERRRAMEEEYRHRFRRRRREEYVDARILEL